MLDHPTRSLRRLVNVRNRLPVRLGAALMATLVLIAVFVISAAPPVVYATDIFGPLRAPGQPAFIVGHRGDRAVAPENTLPALERAMESLAFVETDVQLTRDGVPVLFHDTSLERVTGESGRVADRTLAELRELDAGAWYSRQFRGEPIPTLEEFLVLLKAHDSRALIELKASWTPEEVRIIDDLLGRYGVRDRVVLQSFSIETLTSLQQIAPLTPRIMLIRELPADPLPLAERFGVIGFGTTVRSVVAQPHALTALHVAGLGVLCYTLNTQDHWAEVIALGVDGIITDQPSDLDQWLATTSPGT